jgi:ABC-type multidrug transport system ATPase subunit
VLLRANGSGKSTTLDAIVGLNTVTSGAITVDGTGELGIVPQKNVLWDELTVEERIRIFNELKSTGQRDSKESLHELSSGLDPLPRRKIWDILLAERSPQATIMATNFLDEADLLADQIAILSKGTFRAQGSSAALNHILGCGY